MLRYVAPAFLFLGLIGGPAAAAVQVAVSIPPQVWLVDRLGGERVEAFHLVPAGASPATYQPTDAQVTRLMRSALYLRIGVPFENAPWFDAVRRSRRVKIVDLRAGIELGRQAGHEGHGHDGAGKDPHIWLSPRLLEVQARTAAGALAEVDPEHAAGYRDRLARLEAELQALDLDLRRILAPVAGRAFFVFHPAWGYFADAYGLRQVAVESGGKEPSDRALTRLQVAARAEGVKVVFVQPQIAGRMAEAVARGIGGRVETLDPLAPDVGANLRRVAEALRQSYE